MATLPQSVDETQALLSSGGYVTDRALATSVFLSLKLARPLFLEGEAGVGKTEVARVLSSALGRKLIRLQCYEGLDIASAVYEWNYARQMLEIRLAESAKNAGRTDGIFSELFLIERPLLAALRRDPDGAPVLLIDELDRADEPFEAFLLEMLAGFQITIPEIGTIAAVEPPLVVITSNRTREIHDALKRRCFYHWVDYPTEAREFEIVGLKVPGVSERLSRQVVAFIQKLRKMDLFKVPGVAETIDWTQALMALEQIDLDEPVIDDTLGAVLKYQDDIERVRGPEAARRIREVRLEQPGG